MRVIVGQDNCERTRRYAVRIIKLYQSLEQSGAGRVLGKQLLRSGTSIGANVEEAQAAQRVADFVAKMNIALKEARESRYWLLLLAEAELLPVPRLAEITNKTEESIKVLFSIIQKAKRRNTSTS